MFLWTTFPKLYEAFDVINAWGFEYKTVAFVWIKRTRTGNDWFTGLGYWTRSNAELCLLATRGKPKRFSRAVHQLIITPIEEHSKKPDITRDKICLLYTSILKNDMRTAYDILTGTIPDYRRKGISKAIFDKVKILLKERQVELYTTEVKRNNTIAWNLYQSIGFEIKKEIVTTIKTPKGIRQVEQYEIVMKI